MKTYLLILIGALALTTTLTADPLTKEDIASFDIKNLASSSFDTRMQTFRIIKDQNWQKKYEQEAVTAIIQLLKSNDVKKQRTGIQGENLLQYNHQEIDALALKVLEKSLYKSGNQYIYLRQSLIEYTLRQLKRARQK